MLLLLLMLQYSNAHDWPDDDAGNFPKITLTGCAAQERCGLLPNYLHTSKIPASLMIGKKF